MSWRKTDSPRRQHVPSSLRGEGVKCRAHLTKAHTIRRAALAVAFLATSLATSVVAVAQDQSAATGEDVIFARKTIMNALCDKMADIEQMIARGKIDLHAVHGQADAMSVMLMAFPHLFPPGTNQWKFDLDQDPVAATLASPDLWANFPDFYRRSATAAKIAFDLSRAEKTEDIKTGAREMRIACDTCHSLYLETQ
jgi:cytochrome c556